jgi:hypothetical protein
VDNLITLPIEEVKRIARDAGRKAFMDKMVIERVYADVRFDWIGRMFPSSLGIMDDDAFDEVISEAVVAFEAGVEDYCQTLNESGARDE